MQWWGFRHYFWETKIDGQQQFDSGTGQWGFLNHTTHKDGDDETSLAFYQRKGTEFCQRAQFVRNAGAAWPNWTLPYTFVWLNSNTVVSFINYASTIDLNQPPHSLGWGALTWGQ